MNLDFCCFLLLVRNNSDKAKHLLIQGSNKDAGGSWTNNCWSSLNYRIAIGSCNPCLLFSHAIHVFCSVFTIVIVLMLCPAATWKGFRTRWGFIFRVVFLSSSCSVELNIVLGRLRHLLTTYVTVPGLALVTVPLFSLYQSFEQLLQPLVLLPSCVPACMLMIVID